MPLCCSIATHAWRARERPGRLPELPEIYADIPRPGTVEVQALGGNGKTMKFRCGGLLARAIQHEHDHLHGILFIDRMDKKTKEELRPELDALQAETKAELQAAKKR